MKAKVKIFHNPVKSCNKSAPTNPCLLLYDVISYQAIMNRADYHFKTAVD